MNHDFSALEHYDDILAYVLAIAFDEDYVTFAKYLADQDEVDSLTALVYQGYKAARMEIKTNLDRLLEPSQKVAYLEQVEFYLAKYPNFHSVIERGGTKALATILLKPENGPPRDFAIRNMRALLQRKQGNLLKDERGCLILLHVVLTGANETWTDLKEEIKRQILLNRLALSSTAERPKRRENKEIVHFNDLWINELITGKVDSILVSLNLIQNKGGKLINIQPTTHRNPSRPLVAVFRLLEMIEVVRGIQEIKGKQRVPNSVWSSLFFSRYGIEIPYGTAKYIISDKRVSQDFINDVKLAMPVIIEAFPTKKALLKLPEIYR